MSGKEDQKLAIAVAVAQTEITIIKEELNTIKTNDLVHIKRNLDRQTWLIVILILISIFGVEALEKIKGIF